MNAFLHQWKWDFRRIRLVWLFWLFLLAAVGFGKNAAYFGGSSFQFLSPLLDVIQSITVFLFGILLVARLMYTTPFSGAEAFWKTRPLTRAQLFWTKTTMILVLLWLPVVASQLLSWNLSGANTRFLVWGGLFFGAITLGMLILAAVWAAICQKLSSFVLCFASSGAWAALWAILFVQLADRSESFPVTFGNPATFGNHPAVSAGTAVVAMGIVAVTALAAWLIGGRGSTRNSPRAAIVILAVGIALSTTGGTLWKVGLFGSDGELPSTDLSVAVLAADEQLKPGQQLLWNQLAVEMPSGHFALVRNAHGTFVSDDGSHHRSFSTDDESATSLRDRTNALATHYPVHTKIVPSSEQRNRSSLIQCRAGLVGTLEGELECGVFEWVKVASLPFEVGTHTARSDVGVVGITEIVDHPSGKLHVRVGSLLPPAGYRDSNEINSEFFSARHPTYVLYSPDSGTALVSEYRGYSAMRGPALSMESQRQRVEFSKARLFGPGSDRQLTNARLDLYLPVLVATGSAGFKKENWEYYHSREEQTGPADIPPPPALATSELPADPTDAEVDAYLDSILFGVPDRLSGDQWRETEGKLLAIGPAHLDRLLQRLPVGHYIDDLVFRVIRELATDDHRAAIVQTLERDTGLASLVLERGWRENAAPILAKRLARRLPLEWRAIAPAVAIVASQSDPTSYEDLHWHFVHSPTGHRLMAQSLAESERFPLDRAIADAWGRARFESGGRRNEIAPLAAQLGDKEALRTILINVATEKRPEHLQALAETVVHPGGETLPTWVHDNFGSLTFNPGIRKFELR